MKKLLGYGRVLFLALGLNLISVIAVADSAKQIEEWTVTCKQVDNKEKCLMNQTIIAPDDNHPVLGTVLAYQDKSKQPMIKFMMPPTLDQTKKIFMEIDSKSSFSLPVEACNGQLCYAMGNLKKPILDKMAKAKEVKVLYTLGDQTPVVVQMSLKGFNAAFKEVSAHK